MMTIPIIPGPFAFLDSLGEGVGGVIQGKDRRKRRELEDKMRNVGVILSLINSGTLKRQTLADPGMVKMLTEVGLELGGQENIVPSFDESKADFLSQFNKDMGQPPLEIGGAPGVMGGAKVSIPRSQTPEFNQRFPDEQRLLFGAPTSADLAKVREGAAVSGARAGAATSGTPQERAAVTGIPSPQEQIGKTAELGSQLAKTAAAAAMAQSGGQLNKATRDLGWKVAQDAARASGFTLHPERDRAFVDAELYLLDFERQKAEALMAYRSGQGVESLLQRIQQMRQTVVASMNSLEEPSFAQRTLAAQARQRLAADPQAGLPGTLQDAFDFVNQYESKMAELKASEADLEATWRVIMQGQGAAVPPGQGQLPPTGPGGIVRVTLPEQTLNTLIERHRTMKDETQLRQAVLQLGGTEDDIQHILASVGGR